MIESLKITGFRGARDIELESLGHVNLFIGPNGSGKTTLVHAAFLFCTEGNPEVLLVLARPETPKTDAEGVERALSWLFTRSIGDRRVPFAPGAAVSVFGRVDGVARSVLVRSVDLSQGLRKVAPGELNQPRSGIASPDVGQDLNAVRQSANIIVEATSKHGEEPESIGRLYVSHTHGVHFERPPIEPRLPATLTPAKEVPRDIARLFDEVQTRGALPEIVTLLKEMDKDVRNLKLGVGADGSPVIRVDHRRLGLCPLPALGDGFSAALTFALRLHNAPVKFVMYDEFDSSFHVSTIRQLAKFSKFAAERGVQLFLTTHRADTVGAFVDLLEEGWDGLRVFQTRLEKGGVRVQEFGGERLLSVWRDLALDIRVPS